MTPQLAAAIVARCRGTEAPALTGKALAAQQGLAELLGVGPPSSDAPGATRYPALFQSTFNKLVQQGTITAGQPKRAPGTQQTKPPTSWPLVVFHPSGGVPAGIQQIDYASVDELYVDVQGWTQSRSGEDLPQIMDYWDQLFNRRRQVAPLLPVAPLSYLYASLLVMAPTGGQDSTYHAWSLTARYRFILARGA